MGDYSPSPPDEILPTFTAGTKRSMGSQTIRNPNFLVSAFSIIRFSLLAFVISRNYFLLLLVFGFVGFVSFESLDGFVCVPPIGETSESSSGVTFFDKFANFSGSW